MELLAGLFNQKSKIFLFGIISIGYAGSKPAEYKSKAFNESEYTSVSPEGDFNFVFDIGGGCGNKLSKKVAAYIQLDYNAITNDNSSFNIFHSKIGLMFLP